MVRFTLSWRCSTNFAISRLLMVKVSALAPGMVSAFCNTAFSVTPAVTDFVTSVSV